MDEKINLMFNLSIFTFFIRGCNRFKKSMYQILTASELVYFYTLLNMSSKSEKYCVPFLHFVRIHESFTQGNKILQIEKLVKVVPNY